MGTKKVLTQMPKLHGSSKWASAISAVEENNQSIKSIAQKILIETEFNWNIIAE